MRIIPSKYTITIKHFKGRKIWVYFLKCVFVDLGLFDNVLATICSFLPPAYVVRGKVIFWQAVHPSICLSTVPISHNALQHFPECHEAGGYPVRYPPQGGYPGHPRGVPGSGTPPGGGTRVRYPPWGGVPGNPPLGGVPGSGTPPRGGPGRGGVPGSGTPQGGVPWSYLGRTTEGVLMRYAFAHAGCSFLVFDMVSVSVIHFPSENTCNKKSISELPQRCSLHK